MVYDIAWRAWHGMALRGMAWYIVWHYGHKWYMIRPGEVWHGMWKCFHVVWHCLGQWSRSHVEKPMPVEGPVHTYRTRSQVGGPLHVCSVACTCTSGSNYPDPDVQLLFTLGSDR